jgi:hypothetical protein
MDLLPEADEVWTHTRTRVNYIIIGSGLMKIEDGSWVECVNYRNPTGMLPDFIFSRDLITFRKNFTKME